MPKYIDGYVLPVPKKKLAVYRAMALKCARIWREHGALAACECAGEDLNTKMGIPFARRVKPKPGETIVFSWIAFKSRAHRDRVNAAVMKDPRLTSMMDPKKMPFDCHRMTYGGFNVIVDV